jgi:CO/xanthine dehydrogenase Mo-binding subunit
MTGNPWTVSVRTDEILDRLEAHKIWVERANPKGTLGSTLVGTGVACCSKDYGTGADCSLGRVELAPNGAITVHADAVEMGNGIATALARRIEIVLGGAVSAIAVAQTDTFNELGLITTGNPYTITQEEQDQAAKNPRWVPGISSATSGSIGAHVGTQAAMQAARVIFRFGMWPAALALWGISADDPRQFLFEEAFWQVDKLIFSGLPPLAQADIAAKTHELMGVTAALAHTFSRWAWAQASFQINGMNWTADIDALAIRRGGSGFERLDRTFIFYPPTDYNRIGASFTSSCGTAVRIEVDRASGALRITDVYSVLECGEVLVQELVEGQAQGGLAMGVGYALLESLPPFEDGPGSGKWNLGDYQIPRASDLPIHNLTIEVLPPVSPKEPPKGMSEVVMIPIVPALLNAISDATGYRFRSLPVTSAMLKEILT